MPENKNIDRQTQTSLKNIDEGHKARYRFAASRVDGYVLDAACGVGYGSQMMSKVADVTGVDIEEEAIDFAERHYPGPTYKIGDVSTFQGQYDWVVSFETIEHVKDPEAALKNFRQSDKLIISSPNQDHYPFKPNKYEECKYPHLRHYTPGEFEALLNSCGWRVVEKHCQTKKRSDVTRGIDGVFMIWICQ